MSVRATNLTLDSVMRLGLPVVVIQTQNNVMPTADAVDPPAGCIGNSITNATKVPGRVLVLSSAGDTIYDSGDYVAKTSGMTVKLRGNSSARYDFKKPYKFKLQKKGDMLGRGNSYADKDWAIIRNDWSTLSTLVALQIEKILGMDWVPAMKYVNVVFNGKYLGFYMLTETVERNTDCRINVGKTGYIIESDPFWWNEEKSFDGIIDQDGRADHWYYKFTFKYPDAEDVTDEQLEYIHNAVVAMEQSVMDGTYESHLDVNSFVAWLLVHDILGSKDSAGSNRYMTKKDATDKSLFKMATGWDFDTSFQIDPNAWSRIHREFYYDSLFHSSNKAFAKAYVDRWNEVKTTLFDSIHNFLMEYKASDEAVALNKSWAANDSAYNLPADTYNPTGKTVDENIAFIDNWMTNRKAVLDNLVSKIDTTTTITGIKEINAPEKRYISGRTYNIMGQEVSPNTKGLVIVDGRKRFNR